MRIFIRGLCRLLGVMLVTAAFIACSTSDKDETFPCPEPPNRPDGLVVAGSGACLDLAKQVSYLFREIDEIQVTVPSSIGTGGAVKALVDGAIDIGLGSRSLKESERRLGIVEIPIARAPLVFAVHHEVKTNRLTEEDLFAIYEGEKSLWSTGRLVVPLLREPGDSSRLLLNATMPRLEKAMAEAERKRLFKVCYTDKEMADAIASIPGSIGFIDLGTLRFGGTEAKIFNLFSSGGNVYREKDVSIPIYLFTLGEPKGDAKKFIDFAKSEAIDSLLQSGGYTRLEKAP